MQCPQCQAQVGRAQLVCDSCGAQLTERHRRPEPPDLQRKPPPISQQADPSRRSLSDASIEPSVVEHHVDPHVEPHVESKNTLTRSHPSSSTDDVSSHTESTRSSGGKPPRSRSIDLTGYARRHDETASLPLEPSTVPATSEDPPPHRQPKGQPQTTPEEMPPAGSDVSQSFSPSSASSSIPPQNPPSLSPRAPGTPTVNTEAQSLSEEELPSSVSTPLPSAPTPWYFSIPLVVVFTMFCALGLLLGWVAPWPVRHKVLFTVGVIILWGILGLAGCLITTVMVPGASSMLY